MQRYRVAWHCDGPKDMEKLASQLAGLVHTGDVITLTGDLGTGKTTFARSFIRALPGGRQHDVTSPTFTLLQTYPLKGSEIWHYDLYRLEMEEELYELGLEQAFEQGITLIEWPEKAQELIPKEHLALVLQFGQEEEARECELYIPATMMERFATMRGDATDAAGDSKGGRAG